MLRECNSNCHKSQTSKYQNRLEFPRFARWMFLCIPVSRAYFGFIFVRFRLSGYKYSRSRYHSWVYAWLIMRFRGGLDCSLQLFVVPSL